MQSSNDAQDAAARGLIVLIGTGGTIAGSAARTDDHLGYSSGTLSTQDFLDAVPALAAMRITTEQIARLDSKDMDQATWQALARCCAMHLARPEVEGVVVTHGTDTLEETAYFLHRTVAAAKPLVLTAAMRPATALSADGPQNLLDAVTLARTPGARGVLAVMSGRVHAGADLRKLHGYRVDTFSSGDAGVVALLENGHVRLCRPWPQTTLHAAAGTALSQPEWPVVEIVTSHAGARGATVDALVAAGAAGIVLAGTGNGTVHHALESAAVAALARGVQVRRASRCVLGGVVDQDDVEAVTLPSAGVLTPVQARIELMLDLLPAPA